MLVLSRKPGERIMLPELGIEILLVRLGPHSARIGIEAPPEISILREEFVERAPAEVEAAAREVC